MNAISYRNLHFPSSIIQRAVLLYARFNLSLRDVEELMAERGVEVSYETIRRWVKRFGPPIARGLRRGRPRAHPQWHLDEMYVAIGGRWMYLWRVIDQNGEVLDILVQARRDTRAALKLTRKLLKKHGFTPRTLVTDKWRAYGAAFRELGLTAWHHQAKRKNNRIEGSHVRVRRRERAIDIELQQNRRMIARPAGRPRCNPAKPEATKIKLIDKDINHPHRIVVTDPVFQPLGEQSALRAVQSLNKTLHQTVPPKDGRIITSSAFLHSLGQERPFRPRPFFARLATKTRRDRMPQKGTGWRIPSKELEGAVAEGIRNFLRDQRRVIDSVGVAGTPPDDQQNIIGGAAELAELILRESPDQNAEKFRKLIDRVDLGSEQIRIMISPRGVSELVGAGNRIAEDTPPLSFEIPVSFRRRGVESKIVIGGKNQTPLAPDVNLIQHVRRSHDWWRLLTEGEVGSVQALAEHASIDASDVTRFLPFAFLAPDIVEKILDGRQPIELNVERLKKVGPIPADWNAQRRFLGFAE